MANGYIVNCGGRCLRFVKPSNEGLIIVGFYFLEFIGKCAFVRRCEGFTYLDSGMQDFLLKRNTSRQQQD